MAAYDHQDHTGYTEIFNGQNLDGWDYPSQLFRVENGEIVAGYNPDIPPGTSFAIYTGSEPADFDLLVDIKSDGGNTGVHFRSVRNDSSAMDPNWPNQDQLNALLEVDLAASSLTDGVTAARTALNEATFAVPANEARVRQRNDELAAAELAVSLARASGWADIQGSGNRLSAAQVQLIRNQYSNTSTYISYNPGQGAFTHWYVGGYQADYPAVGNIWEGGLRGLTPPERGNLTTSGNITVAGADRSVRVIATVPTSDEEGPFFKAGEWNQYHIMARGNVLTLFINGHLISQTTDDNPASLRKSGVIALQIEGAGKQHFKNIWLKEIE